MLRKRAGMLLDWLSLRINLTEIVSLLTNLGLLYANLDTRKPLREALAEAFRQPLPSYSRWPRVLGLISLVLLLWQVFSGGLLSFYYIPSPESAHESVRTILRDVHFGWFISEMHAWGASLLLAVLIIRLIRFYFQRVYRSPRELIWVFAVLLLIACVHADMTGRLLPWTSTGYWSSVRTLETLESIPVYGSALRFLLATEEIGDFVLIRSYALHAAVLPMVMLSLVFLHFSALRRVGLTEVPREESCDGSVAYRRHLANIGIVLALVFGVLMTAAILWPFPFEGRADPFVTPVGVMPPWYLLAPFGFLELVGHGWGRVFGGTILLCGVVVLIFVPLVDGLILRPLRREIIWASGALAVLTWLVLTIYGARVA